MNAGRIIIKTEMDNSDLKKGLQENEKSLKQFEKETIDLTKQKATSEANIAEYENALELIKQLQEEELKNLETEEARNRTIEGYESATNIIQEALNLEKKDLADINKQIEENAQNQEKVKQKIIEINNQLEKNKNISNIKNNINNIGKSINNITKKIGRWALALIGIRSVYMGIRSAINLIASEDEQFKADLDYIRNAFLRIFEPIARRILDIIKQIMYYVAYIIKAWTGKNIFENANKNLSSVNKNANKLKNTLSGFDEMNVLSDTSGGNSGGVSPSFDLSNIDNVEIPDWIKWIADNGELIKTIIEGIGTAIAALKLANLFKTLGLFADLPLWQLLGGLALIIAGIALVIKGVIDFINDPSWHNFLTILEGIALVVAGIAILMGGWIVALIALGVAIVAYVIQNWDKVKEILGVVGSWIYDHIIKPVADFFVGLWNGIVNGFNTAIEWIKTTFNNVVNFFKGIINTIVTLFKNIGTKVGDVIGGAFKRVINGVLNAIENILNFPIKSINKLINVINKIPGINLGTLQTFKLPRLAKGAIFNYPGRGVDYNGANVGERGMEGLIPLTDNQQMDLLGESIARHMVINLTNINQINGRTLNKELKRIQNENNFAFNR